MENKLCSRCNIEKNIDKFYFKKTENRVSSWCKSCTYKFQRQRWTDRKRKAIELFGGKCCKCGYNKNYSVLEFHHVNSNQKSYEWNSLKLRKWSDVIEELKKCILVCKNCHAEIHYPIKDYTENDNKLLNIRPTGKCPICLTDIYGNIYCSMICARIGRRKVERPTMNELKNLLEQKSVCAIARDYNVSDNAIRKWAKVYGLM